MDHPLISDQAYSDLSATLTDAKITINYRIDFKVINTGYHLVKMTIDRYTGDYDQQYASFWYKGSVDNITEKENSVFSGICETQHDKKF
jgi:hypothetical protein